MATIKTDLPSCNTISCCAEKYMCPLLYWKITIKGLWQVEPPILNWLYQKKNCQKITEKLQEMHNFTILSTTYSPLLQLQLTCSLLKDGSLWLLNSRFDCLAPASCPTTQQATKLLAPTRIQGSFLPPSAWNTLPLLSELTAALPARLSSNVPSSRKQIVFPTGYPQHIVMAPGVYMSLGPASPWVSVGIDSDFLKYNSTLNFQSQKTVGT